MSPFLRLKTRLSHICASAAAACRSRSRRRRIWRFSCGFPAARRRGGGAGLRDGGGRAAAEERVNIPTRRGKFTVYTVEGGKLKKYTAHVTGVMVGRKGYGTAAIKKPAASAEVTIE